MSLAINPATSSPEILYYDNGVRLAVRFGSTWSSVPLTLPAVGEMLIDGLGRHHVLRIDEFANIVYFTDASGTWSSSIAGTGSSARLGLDPVLRLPRVLYSVLVPHSNPARYVLRMAIQLSNGTWFTKSVDDAAVYSFDRGLSLTCREDGTCDAFYVSRPLPGGSYYSIYAARVDTVAAFTPTVQVLQGGYFDFTATATDPASGVPLMAAFGQDLSEPVPYHFMLLFSYNTTNQAWEYSIVDTVTSDDGAFGYTDLSVSSSGAAHLAYIANDIVPDFALKYARCTRELGVWKISRDTIVTPQRLGGGALANFQVVTEPVFEAPVMAFTQWHGSAVGLFEVLLGPATDAPLLIGQATERVKFFPCPARSGGNLSLELPSGSMASQVTAFDLSGRRVALALPPDTRRSRFTLRLPEVSPGVYLIQVSSSSGRVYQVRLPVVR